MLEFVVQGSIPGGYKILAKKSGARLTMSCSCEAGLKGTHCKHRFALLAGDVSGILSGNEQDLAVLHSMLSGTALELRFRAICRLEQDKEAIETKLKSEKKAIAREMGGGPIS